MGTLSFAWKGDKSYDYMARRYNSPQMAARPNNYSLGCYRAARTIAAEWERVVAATQGDLIQLVAVQNYLGQEILNVYYYRYILVAPAVPPYLDAFIDQWETTVLTPIRALQATLLTYTELRATNLSNNIDFAVQLPGVTGTVATTAAQAMPSYVTAGFQLIRETLTTRNGYKRFSGLNDATIEGNTLSYGAAITNAAQTALAADINAGAIAAYEPIIYRRSAPPPVGTAYVYSSIGSALFKGLGTQNTRKPD